MFVALLRVRLELFLGNAREHRGALLQNPCLPLSLVSMYLPIRTSFNSPSLLFQNESSLTSPRLSTLRRFVG